MPFVLDASVVMGWCFEDETTPYADRVLDMLDGDMALVPSVWPLEIANALCVGERRHRLQAADTARFTALVHALPIKIDCLLIEGALGTLLDIARAYRLSSYDASYLELVMREGLQLATLDQRLRATASEAGVKLVQQV